MAKDEDKQSRPYPTAPDLKRVRSLRKRLRADKATMDADGLGGDSRLTRKAGKSVKDIGTYTLIPSLMIAGPIVGYLLGRLVERVVEIAPWGAVVGMLLGVTAAFRQVFLLLKRQG